MAGRKTQEIDTTVGVLRKHGLTSVLGIPDRVPADAPVVLIVPEAPPLVSTNKTAGKGFTPEPPATPAPAPKNGKDKK